MEDEGDRRLIEAGFPCHQVGAETQRERGASSALPALYFLHVWWARRPLIPSRAAIVASLERAGSDAETFVRRLGIEKMQVEINRVPWTLTGDLKAKVVTDSSGGEVLPVDAKVLGSLQSEDDRRAANTDLISKLRAENPALTEDRVLVRWAEECTAVPHPWPEMGDELRVRRSVADPAWANERIAFEKSHGIRTKEDKYGYDRAYKSAPYYPPTGKVVLDPVAGGGSIPFEALRLGHNVIANELNPVATIILYATLDYPIRFGPGLADEIDVWGNHLISRMRAQLSGLFPPSPIPDIELRTLSTHLKRRPQLVADYTEEVLDAFLYVRQVTCPHCGGEAPLLNSSWLSKEAKDPWGVRVITDGAGRSGKVRFEPYRVVEGHGPKGEDPDLATVNRGTGQCVHCSQAIDEAEIKAQARGESPLGRWRDRLYCVVAVRLQPKLDRDGRPRRYATGPRKGKIKTEKVRFFRAPNERDLKALAEAEKRLAEKWEEWDAKGVIPTETLPQGSKTGEPLRYGTTRWCDMFTPRQLLGHVAHVEELNRLKPEIMAELGTERGRAVVTYLQFAIDKGVDYNSKQTRWIPQRTSVSGTFSRHDFALKWTFGEMIFTGPSSGAAWGLSQVLDAYKGIAKLIAPIHCRVAEGVYQPVKILHGTAAHLDGVADRSVDLVCIDPPYYDNVQYAELSDFYYVWERRTLADLYPDVFNRRLTNKQDEAVANPARDGAEANVAYERMMGEIFAECRRVLKNEGLMTVMFTHKTQEAWEALTRSLIESGWSISSSVPVDSEFAASMHQLEQAAAASSIFLACRKRTDVNDQPALWTGFGETGVQARIREAVGEGLKDFEPLRLNAVDEMVASYGRALQVLSEQWPVMDGDEPVGPIRAMNEASSVVAASQIERITNGRIRVEDIDPESAMALTLFGIFGVAEFPYDEALNLSRSLNIALMARAGGYAVEGRMIGFNAEAGGGGRRAAAARAEDRGYPAPLVRRGSKLRLALPEERDPRRLDRPRTDWDRLHGLIQAYREGDVPVARQYLETRAEGSATRVLDLLDVWAAEIADPALRREAQTLRFGLRPAAA